MNAQFDEAKLTAYALGELDETDRAEIDRLLNESPDARDEVESIRSVAGLLTEELSAEPAAALNATHRQQIEATLLAGKIRKWVPTALAASILLALVGVSASFYSSDQTAISPSLQVVASTLDVKSRLATVLPSLQFNAAPLEDVFDVLSSSAGIEFAPNWPALEAVAIEKDSEVSLNVQNVTVEKALQLLLDTVGAGEAELAYASDSRRIQVSTLEDLSRQRLEWQGGEYQVAFAPGEVVPRPSGGAQSLGGGQGLFGGGSVDPESADENTNYAYDTGAGADSATQELWAQIRQNNTQPKQFTPGLDVPPSTAVTTVHSPQEQQVSVPTFRGRQIKLGQVGDGTNAQGGLGGGRFLRDGAQKVDTGGPVLSDADNEALRWFGYTRDLTTNSELGVHIENGKLVLKNIDGEVLRDFGEIEDLPKDPKRLAFDISDNIRDYRGRGITHPENTGEAYARIFDNPFLPAMQNPLSTFSIDVDTASYSNIRRMLTAGQRPPADAVRIEEMINYFSYDYAPPTGDHPFSVNLETASCPWNGEHRLVRVGLKGVEIELAKRPVCNLVFLIDVSGSMDCPNKLPLVKQALSMLVGQLSPEDRVAMVVYAGASGLALPSTSAGQREKILDALDHLNAGGSTNGGEGIQLAYQIAEQNRTEGGVNRVILATDGDFNVGISDQKDLTKLITDEAKSGVFLSVLGFGMGNLKDATLEQLADKGNGNYAYIDTFAEAKKVLVDQIGGTLITIAKDVKIQIEFNPAQVAQYRLIGYENRMLAAQDFNDDKKDAGEIGAGHTVTALYEIVPTTATLAGVDTLKYQTPAAEELRPSDTPASKETLTVKLRYKQPTGQTSQLLEVPLTDNGQTFDAASPDLRFAASVAGFGMLLRSSPHKGDLTYDAAIGMAVASMGRDPSGQRSEFIDLVRKAKTISGH
ncbi:MAG: hypothetical protein AMXMBFR20_01450 [Planctomycetia bacterium]